MHKELKEKQEEILKLYRDNGWNITSVSTTYHRFFPEIETEKGEHESTCVIEKYPEKGKIELYLRIARKDGETLDSLRTEYVNLEQLKEALKEPQKYIDSKPPETH